MIKILGFLIGALNGEYTYDNSNTAMYCMSVTIWFESRGDGIQSMVGVANNIIQRVESNFYPNTVCEVVHQVSNDSCAYSWWCDGKKDIIDLSSSIDRKAFIQASLVADAFLNGEEYFVLPDFDNALLYHSNKVSPDWSKSPLTKYVGTLGSHRYYLESRSIALK